MKLAQMVAKTQRCVKNNAPTILTCLGAIEGAIDSLVVTGTLTVIAGTIIKVASKKK